jgi:hypothetical protein
MTKALRRMRILILVLAVGALGFGASTATAEPPRVPECTDPSANGACSSNLGCQRICDRAAPGSIGSCDTSTYCCYCIEF